MNLIKTSILNGIAVAIKMLTLLGLNKILAIYVGPAGYAAIGQFQNAIQIIITFASGAINTGVTKYTAEYHDDIEQQHKVWRTAGSIALTGSLLAALLIYFFNKSLAEWILKDEAYASVFTWLSISIVFFTFNSLLLAILNGKKSIGRYVVANIAGSIFALAISSVMVIVFGLYGALVSLAIYQSLTFFVTLFLCHNATWFKIGYLIGRIDKNTAKNFLKYTAMALTSAICVPVTHIIVRNHLGETLGWDMAGYWEAMWRLSSSYLMLVTLTLSVYYLPKLSELKKFNEIKNEIIYGYKIIFPIAIISGLTVYALKDYLILILFTEKFLPMRSLFAWQITGDIIKIGAWVVSYVMLGKAMYKSFIITEIIFSFTFLIIALNLTNLYGLQGVAIAHALNYFLYWIAVLCITAKNLNKHCI